MDNLLKAFAQQLRLRYDYIMTEEYCNELAAFLEPYYNDDIYRPALMCWLTGQRYSEGDDVLVSKLDPSLGDWSLYELAERLDPDDPNIPAAAFLLIQADEYPRTLAPVLACAEEQCSADRRIIDEGRECTVAEKSEGRWWFFCDSNAPDEPEEDMESYQLWQILLNCAKLAYLVSDGDMPDGTQAVLCDDGSYSVTQ